MTRPTALWLLAAALAAPCAATASSDVAVVLGSDLSPYRETSDGIKDVLGDVAVINAGGPGMPRGTRVVIAVGTKAALERYPKDDAVLYCIAPGLPAGGAAGRSAKINMTPPPGQLIEKMRMVQPGLKRLGVIWGSPWFAGFVRALTSAAQSAGIRLVAERIDEPEDIPDALRALKGKVDALWTPMDPRVLGPVSMGAITPFCESSGIPYYAPAASMIHSSAVAIAPTFRDVGHAAGQAAQEALKGAPLKGDYYPDHIAVLINEPEAARMHLNPTPAAIKAAEQVLP